MLSIKGLSFSYEPSHALFQDLNLELPKGSKILIVSEPGSGKTTLAKILTGAISYDDDNALSGSVTLDGEDLLSLARNKRMSLIARTSQDADEMLLFSSPRSDLRFPLENLGLDDEEIARKTDWAQKAFGLESFIDANIGELSGGEKRRIALASLFTIGPEVLLLDEPFDELSPRWRERLRSLISKSEASSIVFASHYIKLYDDLFDSVLSIRGGVIMPYRGEELPPPLPLYKGRSKGRLEVKGVRLSLRRRGEKENSFHLSVPSFSLMRGDVKIVMGENGAGKSTFLRMLTGLLKEEEGEVLFDGRHRKAKERRSLVAAVMQNPFSNLFLPTVGDELRYASFDAARVRETAEAFSLRLDDEVASLSYGRAKMLQAGVFSLLDRPYAVFDEIDNALSYRESLSIIQRFLESHAGVVVITHDRVFAELLQGDILEMEEGELK